MKEIKKYQHAFERSGLVYVSGTVKNVRYRLSTGKQATSANLKWVDVNWRTCIESIVENADDKKVGKIEESLLLKHYGKKSLEANAGNRRELTNTEYFGIFKIRIVPFFGETLMSDLKATDLKLWQSKLKEEGLSGARISNIRNVFSGILNDAYGDGLIDKNPFTLVKGIKKDNVYIMPFTLEEANTLIDTAEGWFKHMITVAFFTGMRTGEMMALRWDDIDFASDTIYIRNSIRSGKRGDVKTMSSNREIMMLPSVKEALKNQYLLTGLKNKEIFLSSLGDGFGHSKSLSKYWHRLCQKCEFARRDFYHTRHSFASIMISHGEDILWVSNMMGHKDISMVIKKYAKYRKDDSVKRASFLAKNDIQIVTRKTS